MKLSFQRPAKICRTFTSRVVDEVINDLTERMIDKDLAQIFINAFPNTLDTTIRWHEGGSDSRRSIYRPSTWWFFRQAQGLHLGSDDDESAWKPPQSFIVTGDINAEWLRDSTNQLIAYHQLARYDPALEQLILGAINTQVEFVLQFPYCNAFQPPPPSGQDPVPGAEDLVYPVYDPAVVFECKYELDSLTHFLSLANQFHNNTGSIAYVHGRWYSALETVLEVIDAQSQPTFDDQDQYRKNRYTFQRKTEEGTETLNLGGIGNPLNNMTGLVRSAFRPSDDASTFGFFIPANAMLAVELNHTADVIAEAKVPGSSANITEKLRSLSERIRKGVWEHGVFNHKVFGEVFAFEVDGYGSALFMDDANIPSLLSLPFLGFVEKENPIYRNTRNMILSTRGNPYFLQGEKFQGVGGPHIDLRNAWPMSVLMRALTSDDDDEILSSINMVRDSSLLGLVHESVNVNRLTTYTRPWFAWANSVFAHTILDIAQRKPHLLFGKDAKSYNTKGTAAKMGLKTE